MMKKIFTSGLWALAFFATSATSIATATVFDITTFAHNTEQGRIARYTTALGSRYGDSIGFKKDSETGEVLFNSQGLYDYTYFRGNGYSWWAMNDGVVSSRRCDTYDHHMEYTNEGDEDFVGYQFKMPATVQEIVFENHARKDGGTFDGAPRVEVLMGGTVANGGTWQTVASTWNTPYNSDYGNDGTGTEYRSYTITPDVAVEAWGVRLIGNTLGTWTNSLEEEKSSSDYNGYLALSELQVTGDVSVTDTIDLSTNLAAGQTAIWAGGTEYIENNEWVTDGYYDDNGDNKNHYVRNRGYDAPDDREYLGVMFDIEESDVAAIGTCLRKYYSNTYGNYGGLLSPENIDVEYTTDGGDTWIEVTNLDIGRYADDFDDILDIPWSFCYVGLFTFDTIEEAIDGIRIVGTPYGNSEYETDPDGFLCTSEIEVFAAAVPEPGTLCLLAMLGVCMLGIWRRR